MIELMLSYICKFKNKNKVEFWLKSMNKFQIKKKNILEENGIEIR